jgi:hypothetical protein
LQIDDTDAEKDKTRRALRQQVDHPYITRQHIQAPRRLAVDPSKPLSDSPAEEGGACDRDD